ncbi:hypothetical protein K2173_005587 [Erythroxylum novogranatense]|uniref:Uncharacterized protein n=1 Tax=Erythroxylum novogranatense TaxID=1862640 RepID=A0AAV8T516_9ROSI|nr:hypothetical protein K2173_005587 [Erythroxylum novogranatense]
MFTLKITPLIIPPNVVALFRSRSCSPSRARLPNAHPIQKRSGSNRTGLAFKYSQESRGSSIFLHLPKSRSVVSGKRKVLENVNELMHRLRLKFKDRFCALQIFHLIVDGKEWPKSDGDHAMYETFFYILHVLYLIPHMGALLSLDGEG